MKNELAPGQVIATKKNAIRKLNNLLEGYINSNDPDYLKKAYLLSSWIQQFISFVSFERQFEPTKNISYKRGNIIKVNFGFNVGCELGGPHYAVVLDKKNKHSSNTVTVIPLISSKEKKPIYERDVFLGNELYSMLKAKFDSLLNKMVIRIEELQKMRDLSDSLIEALHTLPASHERDIKISAAREVHQQYLNAYTQTGKELSQLKALEQEISQMKEGSIARIEQITSISKMRIWIPKKTSDVLYNISYSENTMKKINEKIKELFVFDE